MLRQDEADNLVAGRAAASSRASEAPHQPAFTTAAARSPAPEGGPGRALRGLPDQQLRLELGGRELFEVLDAERLDEEALKADRSIEDELGERAAAAYRDLMGGH